MVTRNYRVSLCISINFSWLSSLVLEICATVSLRDISFCPKRTMTNILRVTLFDKIIL